MNGFDMFELFIKRASFKCIRESVQKQLDQYNEQDNISQSGIETTWQLRDFLEVFDVLYNETTQEETEQ